VLTWEEYGCINVKKVVLVFLGNCKKVLGIPSTGNIGCFASLMSGLLKKIISI
jgi:hypothetical protein